MIVYAQPKSTFLKDAFNNSIHTKILTALQNKLGRSVGESEIASWRNSMQFMSQILSDHDIPDESNIAIEFNVPGTAKRIDLIICGRDGNHRDMAVIVELKQWSKVSRTDKDAIVSTRFGRGEIETLHPSYQAWSYAALIYDFNETVRKEEIQLQPCAYLHNLDDASVIKHPHYQSHLDQAPCFISTEAQALRGFLKHHIQYGDVSQILERIENGKLRPSKNLADALSSMIAGNPEFVMIDDQKLVFETAIDLATHASEDKHTVLIVKGGPGTGKSVVAVNLLTHLTGLGLVTQYISRNAAPRAVYSAKLKGSMKKSHIDNMFKGSGSFTEAPRCAFDALLVDEAHRLNEKSGLYSNLGENQVKELIYASKFTIFFLDEDQQVTLKDIGSEGEIRRWAGELGADVYQTELNSQFRCNGSDGYIAFLDHALGIRETANTTVSAAEYDFGVSDDPTELHNWVREKNSDANKARMVAGYCWDWQSKKDPTAIDISFKEFSYEAQWNLTKDGSLWLVADESVDQVGCIHTCQGLEVDYIGVIIGPDLLVRNGHIITNARARSRMDASIKGYVKLEKESPEEARAHADRIIKNTYRTLLSRGQKGCRIFTDDPETRTYFNSISNLEQ